MNDTIEYNSVIKTPKTCPKFLPFANSNAVIIPTIEQEIVSKSDLYIIPIKFHLFQQDFLFHNGTSNL